MDCEEQYTTPTGRMLIRRRRVFSFMIGSWNIGAGYRVRTGDHQLGKLVLYQLS